MDPTPLQAAEPSHGHRLAWLLGSSRVYAKDTAVARRSTFIEALGDHGVPCDATKLSRWESGRVNVPLAVVRAYEQILGLRTGQLVVAATGFGRGLTRGPVTVQPPAGDPAAAHLRLDTLFGEAFAGGAAGHTWLELGDLLAHHQHLYLLPETWQRICELLASELSRTTGHGFTCRFETLRMLVANPASRRYAVKAVGAMTTHPAATFLIHPAALLGEVEDAQPMELLARVLRMEPSALRAGAAYAVSTKVVRGHFAESEIGALESLTRRMLKRSSSLIERADALALAWALPATGRHLVPPQGLDRETRTALENVYRGGELCDPHTARQVASRLADTAQEHTPIDYLLGQDQMLHRLVRESLFHADPARRFRSALLLSASPYRAQLAEPLAAMVTRSDENTAVLVGAVLFQLAGAEQRGPLLRAGLRERRESVRGVALLASGQVVEQLSAAESATLVGSFSTQSTTQATAAGLRVLGMAGAEDCLASVALSHPHLAAAATWWRENPAVRDRPVGDGPVTAASATALAAVPDASHL
ncbi:hypothetical protein [Nocardioides nanhaiensis]|uniref:HTH cro/C1-type domain-containing protein n=1 Tax=Nocardioides nanhaiensis TaxID=1476871 RepID=A0ABP8X380_9ACTN